MYAGIKDDGKLLINRLDTNEAVILKNMVADLKDKSIEVTELTGETGEFDGVLMNFKKLETNKIETTDDIITSIEVAKMVTKEYIFPVPEDVTILVKYGDYDNIKITSNANKITITSTDLINDTLEYEIKKAGYESINGTIDIITTESNEAILTVDITPTPDKIVVLDTNATAILPEEGNTYLLETGEYTVKASKLDYDSLSKDIEITQADVDAGTVTFIDEMIPEQSEIATKLANDILGE